jgi:carbonic anhydrase
LDFCDYRNQAFGQEIVLDGVNTMMAISAEAAASQIQERLKSLHNLVTDIQSSREKSEHNLTSITKAQERMAHDTKVNASHQVNKIAKNFQT